MKHSGKARQVETGHIFTQLEFDRFARLSGDDNPIHVDPEFAARTRFGRTVAHGLLLCSKLRALIDQLAPGGRLLEQYVMFEAPTYAGDRMHLSAWITEQKDNVAQFGMEVKRVDDNIVTCSGKGKVAL